jgi:protocatechuate 3,4-dioxygenase beta subunit
MMGGKVSRRRLAKHLGALAGGASVLGPGLAHALVATPRQGEGPFYPPKPHAETDVDLTAIEGRTESATGEVILVRGQVTDTAGKPLANARIDVWQANHWGRYDHPEDQNDAQLDPNFQGIGITHTDAEGYYGFKTIMPGAYPLSAMNDVGWRPRHIHFKIAHDSGRKLTTQMYFEGDPLLDDDILFSQAPADTRHLLVTRRDVDAATGLAEYRFDIALDGAVT